MLNKYNYTNFLENINKKYDNCENYSYRTDDNIYKIIKQINKKYELNKNYYESNTIFNYPNHAKNICNLFQEKMNMDKSKDDNHDKDDKNNNIMNVYTSGLSYFSTLSSFIENDNTRDKIRNTTPLNIMIPNINETPNNRNVKKSKRNSRDIIKPMIKEKVNIYVKINNLDDLIQLIEKYPVKEDIEYNINIAALHKIKKELIELNRMIGMKELKTNVLDQLLYYIQDLHVNGNDFMHTVIYGPPGTGKTEIAKIIGKIYGNLGILKKGTFKKVTRSDLIAGYLGQTAIKTKEVIEESLGGVLFIDEAYSLGNIEKKDSFSKECIDTLCEALSNYKDELMVIVAGYKKELDECFFTYNQGLESRFTWRFHIHDYKYDELFHIFTKKVVDSGWGIDEKNNNVKAEWFENKMVYFKYYGRDIENMFSKIKISHSRRIFGEPDCNKTKITLDDLEKGFHMFINNDEIKNRKNSQELNKMLMSIYV